MEHKWVYTLKANVLLVLFLLFAGACRYHIDIKGDHLLAEKAPFFQKYKKCLSTPHAGLTAGGILVFHPDADNIVYYHTLRSLFESQPQEGVVKVGLWFSDDGGRNWSYLSDMEFECLYIHPKSFDMYAVLVSYGLASKYNNKILGHTRSHKLAKAREGGRIWDDITPERGNFSNMGQIFMDPDNPNLISFSYKTGRGHPAVAQAKDDKYFKWDTYTSDEWISNHKGWSWNVFYSALDGQAVSDVDGVIIPQRKDALPPKTNNEHEANKAD